MENEIYNELRDKMEKALGVLKKEFNKIRTGRASLALLDGITVNYYGVPTPLNQVATLNIPESRLITIQPWDKKIIKEIEKAIRKSELGLNPINDGNLIRIAIPPLTEERRKELVKLAKRMAEDCKIAHRNARRAANEKFKDLKKEAKISEDDFYRAQEKTQKITNEYMEKVESLLQAKEKEIMEI